MAGVYFFKNGAATCMPDASLEREQVYLNISASRPCESLQAGTFEDDSAAVQ